MNATLLLAAQLAAADAAPAEAPAASPPAADCLGVDGDPALARTLEALTIQLDDARRPLGGIELSGLATIAPDDLWARLGGKPQRPGAREAVGLVQRLHELGLFAEIRPVLRIAEGTAILALELVELPTVKQILFVGATEVDPRALPFLEAPSAGEESGARCRPARPRRAWVAHLQGDRIDPGIVWRGLPAALERLHEGLLDRGYELATLRAALGPDGTLTVEIDEGRLEALRIEGLPASLEQDVRASIGIVPGQVFVRAELERGLKRAQDRHPTLGRGRLLGSRQGPSALEVGPGASDGTWSYEVRAAPAGSHSPRPERGEAAYTIDGRRLTLRFRTDPYDGHLDLSHLLRHTPVTSFAPGLEATGWVYDPADRAHVALDGLVFVNTGRGGRRVTGGLLREVGAKERFDLGLGARAAVPRLRVAEVGFNVHTLTDTADRWRMSAIDSYVYSILLNRPEVDYFRRTGLTAFVTTRPTDGLTLGAEYRIDRYDTMRSLDDVFTIFNRDEAPWANRPIDDGTMGSVLLRLEWAAGRGPKDRLGGIARHPERSLWTSKGREARYRPFATVNTVEIARPGLGGDARFRFVRLVSDSAAFLPTGRRHGVRLRARAAGKLSGGLPAQKAEELGGWSALRGHRNKELGPGDFSWLGTVELVHREWDLSAFADLGAVHLPAAPGRAARWQGPRLGFGASFDFSADSALVLAWRTDDDARFRPRVRLLFQRTF